MREVTDFAPRNFDPSISFSGENTMTVNNNLTDLLKYTPLIDFHDVLERQNRKESEMMEDMNDYEVL